MPIGVLFGLKESGRDLDITENQALLALMGAGGIWSSCLTVRGHGVLRMLWQASEHSTQEWSVPIGLRPMLKERLNDGRNMSEQ